MRTGKRYTPRTVTQVIEELRIRAAFFDRAYKRDRTDGFSLGAASNLEAMVFWAENLPPSRRPRKGACPK